MCKKYVSGFTLIEILLVVTILGILIGIITPRLTGRSEQAKIAAAKTDVLATIALALDLYELDNGKYPTTEQGLNVLFNKPADLSTWRGPYIKKKSSKDPWGNPYVYKCPGTYNTEGYDLYSYGPDGVEGGGDDIVNREEEKIK